MSKDGGSAPILPPLCNIIIPPVHVTILNNTTATILSKEKSAYGESSSAEDDQQLHTWHTISSNSSTSDLLPAPPPFAVAVLYPSAVEVHGTMILSMSAATNLPSSEYAITSNNPTINQPQPLCQRPTATIHNNSSNMVPLPVLPHSAAVLLYPPITLAFTSDTHDTITIPSIMSTTATVSHPTVAAHATTITPTDSLVAIAVLPTVSNASNLPTNNSNSKKKKETTTTGQADNSIQRYFAPANPHIR